MFWLNEMYASAKIQWAVKRADESVSEWMREWAKWVDDARVIEIGSKIFEIMLIRLIRAIQRQNAVDFVSIC